jgi:F-type H+-transporting ATPase subunit epsilon
MASDFATKVVTPDGAVWEGRAVSVVVPGLDGYFGVWQGHAPLISAMDIGVVMIKTPADRNIVYISVAGGFVEVNPQGVTVLAESAELAESIDLVRAGAAEQRAREAAGKFFDHVEEPADTVLRRALNRKQTAERAKARPTEMF